MRNPVPLSIAGQTSWPLRAARRSLAACLLMLAWASATWAGSVTYSYDALGRVIQASYSTGVMIVYVYDAAGNRTSYVVSGAPN